MLLVVKTLVVIFVLVVILSVFTYFAVKWFNKL